MEKFTVKDFIVHNNPCFSCAENIIIKIGSVIKGIDGAVYLRPTVSTDKTEIVLKEKYSNTLKLQILHNSNIIVSSSEQRFKNYLNGHKLFLHSQCNKCLTTIISQYLEFNLKHEGTKFMGLKPENMIGFIKPVGLKTEDLVVYDHDIRYHIYSNIDSKHSLIYISRPNSAVIRMKIPLYTLSKFKNKDKMLSKLKTYILFS